MQALDGNRPCQADLGKVPCRCGDRNTDLVSFWTPGSRPPRLSAQPQALPAQPSWHLSHSPSGPRPSLSPLLLNHHSSKAGGGHHPRAVGDLGGDEPRSPPAPPPPPPLRPVTGVICCFLTTTFSTLAGEQTGAQPGCSLVWLCSRAGRWVPVQVQPPSSGTPGPMTPTVIPTDS